MSSDEDREFDEQRESLASLFEEKGIKYRSDEELRNKFPDIDKLKIGRGPVLTHWGYFDMEASDFDWTFLENADNATAEYIARTFREMYCIFDYLKRNNTGH